MRLLSLLVFLLLVPVRGSAQPTVLAPGLSVQPLADGVWLHTTTRDLPGYPGFPSHGLVIVSGGEALLVDTAWGDGPTHALLRWTSDALRAPVARAVLTHHHDDRMGGMAALDSAGIPAYALAQTSALAAPSGWPRPDSALAGLHVMPVGDAEAEVFYPGPGHTEDNVVVWLPDQAVLFGGCLVRPARSPSLGNAADAVLDEWARSVARVRERYGDARIVVPSHGPPGSAELLDHTIRLARDYAAKPVRE